MVGRVEANVQEWVRKCFKLSFLLIIQDMRGHWNQVNR